MKLLRIVTLWLLAIALLASTAEATNYYVSPWGNNSNGSSWANAWTHPNSTNAGMDGSDTVFIAPGTYDSTYILPDAANVYACSTLTAMDSLRKVTRLRGTLPLTGGTWLQRGSTNTWRYSIEIPARWNAFTTFGDVGWSILMRIDGGVRTMQHSLNASSGGESVANLDAALEYLKDPRDDDSLYIYTTTNPNSSSWAYGNAPVVMFGDGDDNVSFLGLTIEEGYQGVLVIGTSDITTDQPDSLLVSHCNIRNGSHVMSAGNLGLIFGSGYGTTWTSTQYGEFNTFVADSFDYAWAPGDDFSAGAAFDFYSQRQCLIDSCWFGAGLNMGAIMYKNGGGVKTVKAYANRITNCTFVGTGSTTQKAHIWIGGNSDSVVISGCTFNTARYAAIALYRDDRSLGRIKILNNTFFNCGHPSFSPAIQFSAYFYDSTGSNECKYNLFYDTTTVSPQVQFLQGDVSGSQTPSVESQWDIDSNRYYFKTGGNFVTSFLSSSGCTGTNFAAWRSCGFDVQGDTGINPNFAVAGTNFSRPSASGEMNRTYGGRTWTIYGAVQNDVCPDTLVAPVFQSPSNGATGQTNSVILDWSDSTQAGTVDLYDLQVDNNSDFSSLTFSSSTAWSSDTITATLTHLTTYYWRVRSRSDCDTSAWSGYRSFVAEAYTWSMPSRRANPLNTALDSMSTLDDMSMYLCGMDDVPNTDADTLVIKNGWKVVIWSGSVAEAIKVKQYDPTIKLILYNSIDHGLKSVSTAIDTVDPGNTWNTTNDEYSHYRKICDDSSKSYNSLFYHFAEDTKILLYERTTGGYTYHDTIFFPAATLPISDDDSSSIIPDSYSSPYFTTYGTLDTITVDTSSTHIYRRFNYQGTPQGSRVTRVYLDFSNPLARYAELSYSTRMFGADLGDLGGSNNDVYGWGDLTDAGFYWDGVYYDNSSDEANLFPEAATLISGGNIRGSTGVLGKWNADSTKNKMNSHQKIFFAYTTDYCNNAANFSNSVARITSANFGVWAVNSSRNPITQWYNDSNRINLKLLEFPRLDGGYSSEAAYETTTPLGYSVAQMRQMDSLAAANDFYVLFGGRVNYVDTTAASGWSPMKDAFLRSNWVRLKTTMGHRALFAINPLFAITTGLTYLPCSSGGGTAYGGMIYGATCDERSEVDLYTSLTQLPFMRNHDFGKRIDDSTTTLTLTDGTAQTVSVYKTFWRDVVGTDTTYSWMYYFPRKLSSWEWRPSGNHYVLIDPPPVNFKRLEYDGTLTTISGAAQYCYIGNQLILSYSTATPFVESPMNTIKGTTLKGVTIK